MTAPQRPASNSDARKRAEERAAENDAAWCPLCYDPDGAHHVENLRWDTHSANMLDRTRHGNCHNSQKTHCPANHPYDDTNTHVNRKGQRVCRICQREAGRRHDQKRRGRKRVAA